MAEREQKPSYSPEIKPSMSPVERIDAFTEALLHLIADENNKPNAHSLLRQIIDESFRYGIYKGQTSRPGEESEISHQLPSLKRLPRT